MRRKALQGNPKKNNKWGRRRGEKKKKNPIRKGRKRTLDIDPAETRKQGIQARSDLTKNY